MKISKYLALGFLVISLTPVFGQQPPPTFQERLAPPAAKLARSVQSQQPPPTFQERLAAIQGANKEAADHAPPLTKFNLDFPGGTPAELVKAIEKATGKPLNAIISTEEADAQLPPLKMNDVDAPQLFQALLMASVKKEYLGNGNSYSTYDTYYSFKTEGSPSDNAIWYFYAEKPTPPPVTSIQKVCQFFSLEPYLNRGFTVDDITTAIQTGWKMAGETSPPELNYHKETKLLIAFGEPGKLQTIEQVLKALPAQSAVQRQFDLDSMNGQITALQMNFVTLNKEVGELSKKISAQNSLPAEKSGK